MDLLLLLSILSLSAYLSCGEMEPRVGVCYGELGNNLPNPAESIKLIQNKLKAKRIKIYGTNPDIIKSIADTDIQISVMLPNQLIPNISANQTLADQWVRDFVLPFYPQSKIRYLLIGNEILSNQPNTTWFQLVPAMRKIRASVKRLGLNKVKIGTPLAMDCLESSFPPSNGTFRSSVREEVIKPLLQFVDRTKSFFFVDVYTYFAWAAQPKQINLDYALLQPTNITVTDPVTGLKYTNLLDQMLDALYFAMNRTGYPNVRLFLAETGWPNDGDLDQIGANVYNAATYNRNVVKKFTNKSTAGTPARPGQAIPAMIFALYNENNKTGPGTERHFGQLKPDGSFVYPIDFSGKTEKYPPLPKPKTPSYVGKLWCVVKNGANMTAVAAAQTWACSNGNSSHHTCDAIQPGRECSGSSSTRTRASYAFSSYWAEMRAVGGGCDFQGLANITKTDPSFGTCKFPSVYAEGF
ncbi:probable glucan endo-1 3-beta-glucosidase a6 [Phtheirospermum japonicum]|uniref:glucan endo-1,3-beta-D-glucosidase n=1 Tax=Phtheirospermum japonicum TaxID=374723 RepID=A0A830CBX2_9LAMI|nr:probable glucan endo-1 3-beta-glucosidase a6 [Phtheirospermum japonicum]